MKRFLALFSIIILCLIGYHTCRQTTKGGVKDNKNSVSAGQTAVKPAGKVVSDKNTVVKCTYCENGRIKCPVCKGAGKPSFIKCSTCGKTCRVGVSGSFSVYYCDTCKQNSEEYLSCEECKGTGNRKCFACEGIGLRYLGDNKKDKNETAFKDERRARTETALAFTGCPSCKGTGMADCPRTMKVTGKKEYYDLVEKKNKTKEYTDSTGATVVKVETENKLEMKKESALKEHDEAPVREDALKAPAIYIDIQCPDCKGTGKKKCKACGGEGQVLLPQ